MALAQGRSGVLGGGDENARSYFREVTPPTRDFPRQVKRLVSVTLGNES